MERGEEEEEEAAAQGQSPLLTCGEEQAVSLSGTTHPERAVRPVAEETPDPDWSSLPSSLMTCRHGLTLMSVRLPPCLCH